MASQGQLQLPLKKPKYRRSRCCEIDTIHLYMNSQWVPHRKNFAGSCWHFRRQASTHMELAAYPARVHRALCIWDCLYSEVLGIMGPRSPTRGYLPTYQHLSSGATAAPAQDQVTRHTPMPRMVRPSPDKCDAFQSFSLPLPVIHPGLRLRLQLYTFAKFSPPEVPPPYQKDGGKLF